MKLKTISIAAFIGMVVGILGLYREHALFSTAPLHVATQAAAVLLMLWARLTFGPRSFHATAPPTEGGLVTSGPYRFIRHPIYSAALLFALPGALSRPSVATALWFLLALTGALVRMITEEHLLLRRYPEYRDYASRVKRMIPFVF